MDDFMSIIRAAIARGRAARDGMGDYPGEDGLMHCGKCHEPVEIESDAFPGFDRLPVPCRCLDGNMLYLAPIDEVEEPIPFDESDDECVERLIREARRARKP